VSFRARLRLFFALIVIVPMIALAIVLFMLTARSETGKADAGVAAAVSTAFGVYEEAARNAQPALREVAADRELHEALESGRGIETRMARLIGGERGIVSIELHSEDGELIARAGSPEGVAPAGAPLSVEGQTLGTLAVSVSDADGYAARVRELTDHEIAAFRDGRTLAATMDGLGGRDDLGDLGEPGDFSIGGEDYRGRLERIKEPAGPPLEIAVFVPTADLSDTISRNRLLTGALLVGFLLLALVSATIVSRALTGQIGKFLAAARRLARGDFAHPVPVEGHDEFAQLGREFNSMSAQLEAKIEEVERKRQEEELLEYLAGQAVVSIENAGLHETVERQAVTDELTGLANVRAFHSILQREIERSRRFQSALGLVMVDLDNFKKVNDEHGHQQGDEVLASVASVLRDFSRDVDAPARYGGEELAVVLPGTDSEGAALLAERMREAVERLRVPRIGGRGSLRVTASFGVAAMPESALDKEGLIAAADAALYRAKRGGKNRVERAEPVPAAG
jgi:diguanylate cyclase (GGDEF)-like protein